MRHFTQRLMMAIVATFMAVGSISADDLVMGTMPYKGWSGTYYNYVAPSDGEVTFTFSGTFQYGSLTVYWSSTNGSSWEDGMFAFSSSSRTYAFPVTAGKTYAAFIGDGAYSGNIEIVGPGSGPTPPTAQPGEDPENAIELSVGNSTKDVLSGKDTWYKISVPAGYCVKYSVSYMLYGNTTKMYAGKANADAKTNAIGSSNSGGADSGQGDNTTSGAVDYYICLQANAVYGSPKFSISIEDLSTLTNAKSIGTPAFNVANNANVATSTPSILVTFPNFKKGSLDDYEVKIRVDMTDGSAWIYNYAEFTGTANNGVTVPMPALVDGKKYTLTVVSTKVSDYLMESPDKSVSFTAVNVPDGSEGNPFIITAAGVAGPKAVGYGSYVWYKYVVPMDGVVTISRTWSSSDYYTQGLITVNGTQVRATVPDSWSGACKKDDVVLVKIYSVSDLTGFLVKGSTAAPGPGQSRGTAIDLTEGSNSIALVANGALSNWYKFTVEANYQGTLTFSDGIAAKYYIGESESGTFISNNTEGHSELKYDNESASEEVIYVEVTGTNGNAQTANLAFNALGFADCDADVAENGSVSLVLGGAKNGENVAGTEVDAMSRDFELTFEYAGLTQVNNGVKLLMPDGRDIAANITNWNFDCDKITFSLNSDISDEDLLMGDTWKLILLEDAFIGATDALYSDETSVTWTVKKAEVYNAPTILSATNGGNAAGETVSEISPVFEITLSEASRWAEYGVQYQYEGVSHGSVSVSMSADKKTATITFTGADEYLSQNGEHKLYITVGAFVNANDETKALATGVTFTWTRDAAETYTLNIYHDFGSMYWDKNWTVESGVEVYYGVWNGEYACIDLYQYTGTVVPANQGVIVRSVGAETTVLTATDEAADGTMLGNEFQGTVAPAGVYRNASKTTYVYSKSQGAFARYEGSDAIPAYRAYMEVTGAAPASARMRIVNAATAVENVKADVNVQKQMINGQLFILRDGKMYNVQGVLVK